MSGDYNPHEIEDGVQEFWKTQGVYQKAKEQNKGKEKFTYLDGPPYTSGKIHIGHAWGKALRDCIMRYKRMNGYDVWDRAGFDMHGLPTENKVAAQYGFDRKEDIEEYGVEKFQKECERFCSENMSVMIEDFRRLGVWMDFDDPYMPINPAFIEGVWYITKKVHEKGRLYKGHKVMTWCPSCATSLSKHELEYNTVTDPSIFVKFPLKDREGEYLIIWTTTPWTIPFNQAVMVNPDLPYVRIKVDGEVWVLSKDLLGVFMGAVAGKDYELLEEFPGEQLVGLRYQHIFHSREPVYQELADTYAHAFSVLPSREHVDTTAGTGLVHSAPGCGPADFEVGKEYGLPAFNDLDQYATFGDRLQSFSGLRAKKDESTILEHIRNAGVLVGQTTVEHEYPHCWRCHGPVVFGPTEQWFFKVEDLKERMIEHNKNIGWVPEAAYNAFDAWLQNLRDNGVTRQRYWGTPVPIWICANDSCAHTEVIGSVKELEEKGGSAPEDLHKPWIDRVTFTCPECSGTMERIPDIFDVWIDAGCAGIICYDYPRREDLMAHYYPADLILEGKDQIRGWFNLLMVISTLAFDAPSFKNVYMHGFINDHEGNKMSKSQGNVTNPQELIEEFGADVLRYYSIGAAKAGYDMNFNPEEPRAKMKNVRILWNLHKLLLDSIETTGFNPGDIGLEDLELGKEEHYILSRMHNTTQQVTKTFEGFYLYAVPELVEEFFLDISRTYIQFVRDVLASGTDDEKRRVVKVLETCLLRAITLFAPVAPFVTEAIYLKLKDVIGYEPESIHLSQWPAYEASWIDTGLEQQFELASRIIQAGLQAREKATLGVRWPVPEVIVASEDPSVQEALDSLGDLIRGQLNAKSITRVERFDKVTRSIKPEYKQLGPVCGQDTPRVISELQESPEEHIQALEREGETTVEVDGHPYRLTSEHIQVQEAVAEGYAAGSFRNMQVYLNTQLDEGLESEGFARETMRRVQNLRKKAGLKKVDTVDLVISSPDEQLRQQLEQWHSAIAEKVGARSLSIGAEAPGEADHTEEARIKGRSLSLHLSHV